MSTSKDCNSIYLPLELDFIGLDPFSYRVYLHLARLAVEQSRTSDISAIAVHCRMNESQVNKSIETLVNHQIIELKDDGYHILPSVNWTTIKDDQAN